MRIYVNKLIFRCCWAKILIIVIVTKKAPWLYINQGALKIINSKTIHLLPYHPGFCCLARVGLALISS